MIYINLIRKNNKKIKKKKNKKILNNQKSFYKEQKFMKRNLFQINMTFKNSLENRLMINYKDFFS